VAGGVIQTPLAVCYSDVQISYLIQIFWIATA